MYFADICAGPGGFSEYVLWRTKGESKGFGLTLKGNNDFKLEDFFAGPPEMFEPHYGKILLAVNIAISFETKLYGILSLHLELLNTVYKIQTLHLKLFGL